jgi:site-specific recombinase XerD
MGKVEIEQFLTSLAVEKKVSPSTQNQAFSAILFLYKELLGHKSVETTMIYTHVVSEMNKSKVISPLDF